MAIQNYDELLTSLEPHHAELFKRLIPEGLDNPKCDFLAWAAEFDRKLSLAIRDMPSDEQTILNGYAAIIKRFYARNCRTISDNQRTSAFYINDLKISVEASETTTLVYHIGNAILSQFQFKTARDTKEIYRYNSEQGYYTLDGAVFIEEALKRNGLKLSKHEIAEIIYHIQTSTYEDRENFKGAIDDNLIHVDNGWLDMETGTLEDHTPDRLSIAKIRTKFDPAKGPVEFVRIMNAALEPEFRRTLIKAIGNILVPNCRYVKATMFVGDGHNRKSTILNAIRNVIGGENCAGISLQAFSEDKFATAELYGKVLNMVFDLKADAVKNTGQFKEAISGDPIRAQFKHVQAFLFRPTAKHFYSANDIPPSNDQTNAYFRRWIIIPFYRMFERDPKTQERIATEEEKSGLLNLMLYGRRLLLAEGFDDAPLERIRAMYNKNASAAKDFIDRDCILDIGDDSEETRQRRTISK